VRSVGGWGLGLPYAQSGAFGSAVNGTLFARVLRIRRAHTPVLRPWFGRPPSGEAEVRAVLGVGGSVLLHEILSTAAGTVTLVVLSAPALPFRDGSKEHQGDGGRAGRFAGPHVAGRARRGPHPEAGESSRR
jgi:hypothetical protein